MRREVQRYLETRKFSRCRQPNFGLTARVRIVNYYVINAFGRANYLAKTINNNNNNKTMLLILYTNNMRTVSIIDI